MRAPDLLLKALEQRLRRSPCAAKLSHERRVERSEAGRGGAPFRERGV
jgi:hypothetical protein